MGMAARIACALPARSFGAGRSPNGARQSRSAKSIPSPWGEGRVRGTATFERPHGRTETRSTASLQLRPGDGSRSALARWWFAGIHLSHRPEEL
jgi:hypothetical protein